jgi:lipopolysaccharide transport system ATP-binding protein
MSRVTAPTRGVIRLNGRVASLLEVGTGFHPELTGRENIFLNGAIMGMNRQEIRSRFDEIVDFSGCAKYVDTPVKRYSSGMFVRLAFAVAAHLEPEILIVDEVLAVGDADFQDRCIGKMKEVSEQGGRTVLFVSHNMGSVKRLCSRGVLMENGTISFQGTTNDTIQRYLYSQQDAERFRDLSAEEAYQSDEVALQSATITNSVGDVDQELTSEDEVHFKIRYQLHRDVRNMRVAVDLLSEDGVEILSTSDFLYQQGSNLRAAGWYESRFSFPKDFLNLGKYRLRVDFDVPCERAIISGHMMGFEIKELVTNQLGIIMAPKPSGLIHPALKWDVQRLAEP